MKKQLLLGILGSCIFTGQAQTFKEWQDAEINAIEHRCMPTFSLTKTQTLLPRPLKKNLPIT